MMSVVIIQTIIAAALRITLLGKTLGARRPGTLHGEKVDCPARTRHEPAWGRF